MKKPKGILGYPASDLSLGDVICFEASEYVVFCVDADNAHLYQSSDLKQAIAIRRSTTVRLIRKAIGITYAAWQRQTSKLLKVQGLSRWPGAAVMKPLFFLSYSPEDAAAAFLSDNFLID